MASADDSTSDLHLSFAFPVSVRSARAALRVVYPSLNVAHLGLTILFVGLGLLAGDLGGILIGVAYFFFVEAVVRAQLRPYRGEPFEEKWKITGEEVRIDLRDRLFVNRWTSCRGVKRRRDLWVIRFGGLFNTGFPTSALSAAETEEFAAFLRQRSLLS